MITPLKEKYVRWKTYKNSLKQTNPIKYFIMDLLVETLPITILIVLIIKTYILQLSVVPTSSMYPTFKGGSDSFEPHELKFNDRLLVNKFIYRFTDPKRGDIVVFKSPNKDGKEYVKRCIGLPNETVEVKDGLVYINQKLLLLPGINIQRDTTSFGPKTLPKNGYFMLGDNRANSFDSRLWSYTEGINRHYITRDEIIGMAFYTFWPINRIAPLK